MSCHWMDPGRTSSSKRSAGKVRAGAVCVGGAPRLALYCDIVRSSSAMPWCPVLLPCPASPDHWAVEVRAAVPIPEGRLPARQRTYRASLCGATIAVRARLTGVPAGHPPGFCSCLGSGCPPAAEGGLFVPGERTTKQKRHSEQNSYHFDMNRSFVKC